MITARQNHLAALLQSGKVLVAGGTDTTGFGLSSAEVYNPSTGSWSGTGSMLAALSGPMLVLSNRQALVEGGIDSSGLNALASAELYNPASGTWTATGTMLTARFGQTATLLHNGEVLVSG